MIFVDGKLEPVPDVPCGNLVALVGIDKYIKTQATVTENIETYPLRTMKFSKSPVVRIGIDVEHPYDLPRLVEGLRRLA